MTPPASVRNPLALWLGSWLFKLKPTCTTPNPSQIKPMARIREKIKVDRLLMTDRGSPAASTGIPPTVIVSTSAAYAARVRFGPLPIGIGAVAWFAVCLFGISFLFFNGIPPIKKTAPCRGSPQPRAVHNHPVSWYQWLHLHGTGEPSHNHKAAPLHPPYISHSHVYADHISHPEWGVLHAPEALPSGYPKGVLHRGSKVLCHNVK